MVTTLFVAGGISGGLRGCHVVLHASQDSRRSVRFRSMTERGVTDLRRSRRPVASKHVRDLCYPFASGDSAVSWYYPSKRANAFGPAVVSSDRFRRSRLTTPVRFRPPRSVGAAASFCGSAGHVLCSNLGRTGDDELCRPHGLHGSKRWREAYRGSPCTNPLFLVAKRWKRLCLHLRLPRSSHATTYRFDALVANLVDTLILWTYVSTQSTWPSTVSLIVWARCSLAYWRFWVDTTTSWVGYKYLCIKCVCSQFWLIRIGRRSSGNLCLRHATGARANRWCSKRVVYRRCTGYHRPFGGAHGPDEWAGERSARRRCSKEVVVPDAHAYHPPTHGSPVD